jgi:hypothetical protein
MAAGGLGPYHRLWTDDAPSKRKVVTPTSGGMMPALGFVSYHWGRELLVTPFLVRKFNKFQLICPYPWGRDDRPGGATGEREDDRRGGGERATIGGGGGWS